MSAPYRLWSFLPLLLAVGGRAAADSVRPSRVPLSAGARSVEVIRDDTPIWFTPEASTRRGSARMGARLPLIDRGLGGNGCSGAWYLVGPESFICEGDVRSRSWPATESIPAVHGASLPYDYYFVEKDGSFGYATLRLAEEGVPDSQLEPGFAVALSHVESKNDGERYGLTSHGLWVPLRDLSPAKPSTFAGAHFAVPASGTSGKAEHGNLDVAWTFRETTKTYSGPGRVLPRPGLARLTRLTVVEQKTTQGRQWLRSIDGHWFRRDDVRLPPRTAPPEGLVVNERWLHIDTEEQTLVAYEGAQPIFATLVSTGKGSAGGEEATPPGRYRIWVKLRTTDMTNLENEYANRYYAIEEVPWVMFFHRGYGLHGAFWHDAFGTKRSHGCVNLSPADAHFLFRWAGPELPVGWRAVHPTRYDRGTLVVVD